MLGEDIGLIGCGVMGQSLSLNMADHGVRIAVFDRDSGKLGAFLSAEAAGKSITGADSLQDLAARLHPPRRIILMIPEGDPIGRCIESLIPRLRKGDMLIDAGNSHYGDTLRRARDLEARDLHFLGVGVSGGKEGARRGPSIMVGGDHAAFEKVRDLFEAIAARADDGTPCCDWVGENPAGHFVKMAHNGIEYGNMQMICEAHHVMKTVLGMSLDEMSDILDKWNRKELASYLIEITRSVLRYRDKEGNHIVEQILDRAAQKGTGERAAITALNVGQPFTLAASSVLARYISALKDERLEAGEVLSGPVDSPACDKKLLLHDLPEALLASTVISYAQGFQLIHAAEKEYGWGMDLGRVARLWRAGCIIRSAILEEIFTAYQRNPKLTNLLLDSTFTKIMMRCQPAWRRVVTAAVSHGIPVPALSSALSYLDSYRSQWLPANLLQAMRDYFGAHGYERVDQPRGHLFHTDWTGTEGETRLR